jgi:SH3 domain protein
MKALIFLTAFMIGWSVLGQICMAEKAYISDSFEVTFRSGPSIDNRVILMLRSGEAVEVMKSSGDWTNVRLLGKNQANMEGWVLSRYLSGRIPWKIQAMTLEKQNQQLKADLSKIRKEHENLVKRERQLSGELMEKATALERSDEMYRQLKDDSTDYIALKDQYVTIKSKLESAEHQVQILADDNNKMRNSQNITWFSMGALVLLFGLLIGFVIGRQRKRPRSLIYD